MWVNCQFNPHLLMIYVFFHCSASRETIGGSERESVLASDQPALHEPTNPWLRWVLCVHLRQLHLQGRSRRQDRRCTLERFHMCDSVLFILFSLALRFVTNGARWSWLPEAESYRSKWLIIFYLSCYLFTFIYSLVFKNVTQSYTYFSKTL